MTPTFMQRLEDQIAEARQTQARAAAMYRTEIGMTAAALREVPVNERAAYHMGVLASLIKSIEFDVCMMSAQPVMQERVFDGTRMIHSTIEVM